VESSYPTITTNNRQQKEKNQKKKTCFLGME